MSIQWTEPPPDLQLRDNEVIVWCVSLNSPAPQVTKLRGILSPDEVARAEQFVFEKDRIRYIVARGTLRSILSDILNRHPAHLHFRCNAYGKPALSGETNGIEFNLSHSHDLALIALTWGRSIGVDLEFTGRNVDNLQLAKGFFSLKEQTALLALPERLQRKAFFDCWTRKEAYIKARGLGLSIPLDQFTVSMQPGQEAELLESNGDEVEQWSLFDLDLHPEYSAALATRGRDLVLHCYSWTLA